MSEPFEGGVPESVRFVFARDAPSPYNWYTQQDYEGCLVVWEPPDEEVVGYVIFRTSERLDDDCVYDLMDGLLKDITDRIDVNRPISALIDDEMHERSRYLILGKTPEGDLVATGRAKAMKYALDADLEEYDGVAFWSDPEGTQPKGHDPRYLDYESVRVGDYSAFSWAYPEDIPDVIGYDFIVSRQAISAHTGDEQDIDEFRAVLRGEMGAIYHLEPFVNAIVDNVTASGNYWYFALLARDSRGGRTQIPMRHHETPMGRPSRNLDDREGWGTGQVTLEAEFESWRSQFSPEQRGETDGLTRAEIAEIEEAEAQQEAATQKDEGYANFASTAMDISVVTDIASSYDDAPAPEDDLAPPPSFEDAYSNDEHSSSLVALDDAYEPPALSEQRSGSPQLDRIDTEMSRRRGSDPAALEFGFPEQRVESKSHFEVYHFGESQPLWTPEDTEAFHAIQQGETQPLAQRFVIDDPSTPGFLDPVSLPGTRVYIAAALVDTDGHRHPVPVFSVPIEDAEGWPSLQPAGDPGEAVEEVAEAPALEAPAAAEEHLLDQVHPEMSRRRGEEPAAVEFGFPEQRVESKSHFEIYHFGESQPAWTPEDTEAFHAIQRGESRPLAQRFIIDDPSTPGFLDPLSPSGSRVYIAAVLVDSEGRRHTVPALSVPAEDGEGWPSLQGTLALASEAAEVHEVVEEAPATPDTPVEAVSEAPATPDTPVEAVVEAPATPDTPVEAVAEAPATPDTPVEAVSEAPATPDTPVEAVEAPAENPLLDQLTTQMSRRRGEEPAAMEFGFPEQRVESKSHFEIYHFGESQPVWTPEDTEAFHAIQRGESRPLAQRFIIEDPRAFGFVDPLSPPGSRVYMGAALVDTAGQRFAVPVLSVPAEDGEDWPQLEGALASAPAEEAPATPDTPVEAVTEAPATPDTPVEAVPEAPAEAEEHLLDQVHAQMSRRRGEEPAAVEFGFPEQRVESKSHFEVYHFGESQPAWTPEDTEAFHAIQRGESRPLAQRFIIDDPSTPGFLDPLSPSGSRVYIAAVLVDSEGRRHTVPALSVPAEDGEGWPSLQGTLASASEAQPPATPDTPVEAVVEAPATPDTPVEAVVEAPATPDTPVEAVAEAPAAAKEHLLDQVHAEMSRRRGEEPAAMEFGFPEQRVESKSHFEIYHFGDLQPLWTPEDTEAFHAIQRGESRPLAQRFIIENASAAGFLDPVSPPDSRMFLAAVLVDTEGRRHPVPAFSVPAEDGEGWPSLEGSLASLGAELDVQEPVAAPEPTAPALPEPPLPAPDAGLVPTEGTPPEPVSSVAALASVTGAHPIPDAATGDNAVVAEEARPLCWQRFDQAWHFNRLAWSTFDGQRLIVLWSSAETPPELDLEAFSPGRFGDSGAGSVYELESQGPSRCIDNVTDGSAHLALLGRDDEGRWHQLELSLLSPPWPASRTPAMDPLETHRIDRAVATRIAAARAALADARPNDARTQIEEAQTLSPGHVRILAFARKHHHAMNP